MRKNKFHWGWWGWTASNPSRSLTGRGPWEESFIFSTGRVDSDFGVLENMISYTFSDNWSRYKYTQALE